VCQAWRRDEFTAQFYCVIKGVNCWRVSSANELLTPVKRPPIPELQSRRQYLKVYVASARKCCFEELHPPLCLKHYWWTHWPLAYSNEFQRTNALSPFLRADARARLIPVPLDLSRIIGPMKQCLSLPPSTTQVAASTVLLNLGDMATDGPPALNLPLVVQTASSHIVSAVPLEPSARVFVVDPALVSPDRKRLGCVNAKKV